MGRIRPPQRRRRSRLKWVVGAVVIALVVLSTGFVLYAYQRKQNTRLLLTKAQNAAEAQRWAEAAQAYRQYLNRAESDTAALAAYAKVLLEELKESPEVVGTTVKVLQRLVRVDPQNLEAIEPLAGIYLRLGEFALAEELATRWTGLAPDSADAHLALAAARRGMRQPAQAAEGLVSAVTRMPQAVSLYPALIALYSVELDKPAEARAWLDRALEVSADSSAVQMSAFAYFDTRGETAAAETHLQRALELAPDRVNVLLPAATFYLGQGKLDQARTFVDRAVGVDPQDRGVLFLRAAWAMRARDEAELVATAAAMTAQAGEGQPDLIARAAELYLAANRFEEADECIGKLAAARSTGPALQTWLEALRGTRAVIGDQPFAAIPHLEEVLRRQPSDLQTMELLALAYANSGAVEAAGDAYRKLLAARPGNVKAKLALARLELQQGRSAAARTLVSDLREGDEAQRRQAALVLLACDLEREAAGASPQAASRLWPRLRELAASPPPDDVAAQLLATCFTRAGYPAELVDLVHARLADAATGAIIGVEYGQHLLGTGAHQAAEELTRELLRLFPDSPEARTLHVRLLAATGRDGDAATFIDRLPSDAESKGALYDALADVCLTGERHDAGLQALRQAVSLRPRDVLVRQKLARLAPDREEVISLVDQIRSIEGDAGLTWRQERAAMLLRFDSGPTAGAEAIELLTPCVSARPGWVAAWLLLGAAQEAAQRFADAAASYQAAIAQRPELEVGSVGLRLVHVYKRLGRYFEADAVVGRLADAHPKAPEVLRLLAEKQFRAKDLAGAAATAELLLAQRPDDLDWAAATADLQLRAGNGARAVDIARAGLAAHPESIPLLWALARSLIAQDRAAEAEETVRASAATFNDPKHYWLLAQLLAQADAKSPAAREAMEKAVSLAPENADLLWTASEFYRQRRERSPQLDYARRALTARGERPEESLAFAELLADGGSPQERTEAASIVRRRLDKNANDLRALLLDARLAGASDPPDFTRAETSLQRALTVDPKSAKARQLLAAVQIRRGQLTQAAATVAAALAHNPEDPDLLLLTAEIAGYRGEYERAIAPLRQLLEMRPRMPEAVRLLASAYEKGGQVDRAIDFVEKQAPSDQLRPLEMLTLARLYETKRDYARAEALLQRAVAASDGHSDAVQALLFYHHRRGEYARVHELAVKRRTETPADVPTLLIAAQLLGAQTKDDRLRQTGLDWLHGVVNDHPEFAADAAYRAGMCHYESGDRPQAESLFLQAVQLAPADPHAANALAWLYSEDLGRPADALAVLQRFAAARGEEDAQMMDTHGAVLLRLNQLDAAREKLLACVEIAGQSPTLTAAIFHLGKVLDRQGQKADAAARLREALELDKRVGGLAEKDREEIRNLLGS
ncbi:MAG: tetratricopeptide repeat protein [Planctomycetes bacterium]|nr:tetratricopeptide repeat protein [Planctomycetota bacterium]